jgi:hypothetical protein
VPMQIERADGNFSSNPIVGNVHELVDFIEAPALVADSDADSPGEANRSVPRRPR